MSKLGQDTNPNPGGMYGFQVEASPPNAGAEYPCSVRLTFVSTKGKRLTGAGVFALMAVLTTYLTAAKLQAIQVRNYKTPSPAGGIGVCVDMEGGWVDILPEDGPTQIPLVCAVFTVAANVF